jgi:threonine/homoserine/homoserine lactone efflux protein
VLASAEAFALLKVAGALYLVWLGYKGFRDSGIPSMPKSPPPARRALFARASSSRH